MQSTPEAEPFVPHTERSYWQAIADALNAANAAGMPVGIDLDGTLTDHNAHSVVWDFEAARWTLAGYDDEDQEPAEETRLALVDGRDALATVIIRPADDDPDRVTVEAAARGISKAAVAYTLRQVAAQFDTAALAEGDEPIPHTLTEQAEAVEEQPAAPRVLTWDEYATAYGKAISALGARSHNPGSEAVFAAVDAVLFAVGILAPPPEPDPETCPAQFADLEAEWHQCAEDPDHDQAEGHTDGEWSWQHGDTHARPEPDEDEQAQQ